jgi:RNA polymerase sigma-70 factor (ECF subfamily)
VRHLLPKNEKEREYYLFTVTRNSFLRYTHKIVRQQEGLSELISLQETGQVQLPTDTPALKEQLSIIAEVLTATDAVKKKYFLLNREEGLSYSQIAKQEGVSRKTVERHIGSVLKLLRARLTHLFWLFFLLLFVLVTIR